MLWKIEQKRLAGINENCICWLIDLFMYVDVNLCAKKIKPLMEWFVSLAVVVIVINFFECFSQNEC